MTYVHLHNIDLFGFSGNCRCIEWSRVMCDSHICLPVVTPYTSHMVKGLRRDV